MGELLEWAVEAPGRFTFSPWKAVSGGDDDEDLAWTPELALNETDFCFGDERLLFLPPSPATPVFFSHELRGDWRDGEPGEYEVRGIQLRTSKRAGGGDGNRGGTDATGVVAAKLLKRLPDLGGQVEASAAASSEP